MVKNCVSHISILGGGEQAEASGGSKKVFVILDIIYWFIIISEKKTWGKAFTLSLVSCFSSRRFHA